MAAEEEAHLSKNEMPKGEGKSENLARTSPLRDVKWLFVAYSWLGFIPGLDFETGETIRMQRGRMGLLSLARSALLAAIMVASTVWSIQFSLDYHMTFSK